MFQLIVAVISIALVAALAIASIYYGGSAFSSSSLRANVVTLVNAGQQIAGAQALYKTDLGTPALTIDALRAQTAGQTYLSAEPGKSAIASGSWGLSVPDAVTGEQFAQITIAPSSVTTACAEVSRQAGLNSAQFNCQGGVFNFKL